MVVLRVDVGTRCEESLDGLGRPVPFRRQMQWRPAHSTACVCIGAMLEQPFDGRGHPGVGKAMKRRAVVRPGARVHLEPRFEKQLREREAVVLAPTTVAKGFREGKPRYLRSFADQKSAQWELI